MDRERLEELLDAHFDGALDGPGAARLDAELRGSPGSRRLFWERAAEHALLREVMLEAREVEPAAGPRFASARRRPAPARLRWLVAGLAAAAAAALAFLMVQVLTGRAPQGEAPAPGTPVVIDNAPEPVIPETLVAVEPDRTAGVPMEIAAVEAEAAGIRDLFEQAPPDSERWQQLREKYVSMASRLAAAYHVAAQKAAAKPDREAQKLFLGKQAEWLAQAVDGADTADVTVEQLLTVAQTYLGIEVPAKAREAYERLFRQFDPRGTRTRIDDKDLCFLANYEKIRESVRPPAFPGVEDMRRGREELDRIRSATLGEPGPPPKPVTCQIQLVGSCELPDEKDPNVNKVCAMIKIRHYRPDAENAAAGWIENMKNFAVGDNIVFANWRVALREDGKVKRVPITVDTGAKLVWLGTKMVGQPGGLGGPVNVLFARIEDASTGKEAELKPVRYGGGWWPSPESPPRPGRDYESAAALVTSFLAAHPAYDLPDGQPGAARQALVDLRAELDLRSRLLAATRDLSSCCVELGRKARAEGRAEDARALFAEGLENAAIAGRYWPRNPQLVLERAACLSALGEPAGVEEAVKLLHELRRGVEGTDLWWPATEEEVAALTRLGRYSDARAILAPVLLTCDPKDVEKHWPAARAVAIDLALNRLKLDPDPEKALRRFLSQDAENRP